MGERRIERTASFERNVSRLSRKHRHIAETTDEFLDGAARRGVPVGMKIPGLDGAPVYKVRLPLGAGKRGGARLIYYCSADLVLAMYLYAKSDTEDIPVKRLREAISSLVDQPKAEE